MCGILGIITSRDRESRVTPADMIAMRDTMKARGPDAAGLFQKNNFVFAHRRLAIRDREGGKQPWVSDDGRFLLVYNGEIYNDDQLRRELEQAGVRFRTRSDTEVLMAAWMKWGKSCVNRLRGMFAFCVADVIENKWWLVRDRCGVKPLFYSQIGHDFVFASSLKAITQHPEFQAAPNLVTVRHYLSTLRMTLDQQTVYERVQTVRPAEIIHGCHDRRSSEIYWSPQQPTVAGIDFEEAVDELENRLRESVAMRLKSDVPVGMMLSGGVDSNTLASLIKEENGRPMTGRCGGGADANSEQTDSDFQHASGIARHLGFDYDEVRVDQAGYRQTWEELLEEYATPLSTPTDVIINRVAHSLKQQVGVAIGGEGADEAFCGYTIPHWSGTDFDRAQSLLSLPSNQAQPARESLMRQYGRDRFYSASDHYLTTNGLIPRNTQSALFRESVWAQADSQRAVEKYYDGLFTSQSDRPMVEKYAHVLFRLNLESLLGRLDSATMAASLEARVPFTDHPVVEQAFRLPHQYKIDVDPNEQQPWLSSLELAQRGSLRAKRILRSVAARWMPRQFAERPKQSFPTPLASWLHHDWKPWISQTLKSSPFARELFRDEAIDDLKNLPAGLAMWNWPILNVAMWGDKVFS
jgi:asparagine synthase (glutamine-hydrolysing)